LRQRELKNVNGLDAEELSGIMDTLRNNPEAARLRHRIHNRWMGGTHSRTLVDGFWLGGKEDRTRTKKFELDSGEPAPLLGEDDGPGATESLLHALASCLNATLIYHATARGVQIEELEIELEGELDLRGVLGLSDQVRNGYEGIQATFIVKADASREQIEELVHLAQKHSPVYDMVTHKTPVTAKVEIRPGSSREAA
jgi:uncharacterized OsmC-like protein